MAPLKLLYEQFGSYTIVVSATGRSRSNVTLYGADAETPLFSDELNLSNAAARARFIAQLPALVDRTQAEAACLRLAAGVMAEHAGVSQAGPVQSEEKEEEPWSEPVDCGVLLDDLCDVIRRYVILTPDAMRAIALWIIHTYAIDAAFFTPYLSISSATAACGKTLVLDILEGLSNHPYKVEGITAATMFRIIADRQPTLMVDETDTMLRLDGSDDLRCVLNSGFKRGSKVLRCVGDNHEVKEFPTFCPKVLAGIGTLPNTVASRSIPIRMERATRDERRRLLRINGAHFADDHRDLRRRMRRFSADSLAELTASDPDVPEELGAREADIWRPLFAIADLAGEAWAQLARQTATALHLGAATTETKDVAELLLSDVRDVFEQRGKDRLTTVEIVAELTKLDDRPWPEWSHGRPMTTSGFSRLMGRFGVKSKPIRIDGPVARGYELKTLVNVFGRYLRERPVTSVTSMSSNELTHLKKRNALQVENGSKPLFSNDVTLVTPQVGEAQLPSEEWTPDESQLAFNEQQEMLAESF